MAGARPGESMPVDILTHVTPARLASLTAAPGFAAIVGSEGLAVVLRRVLATGGDLTAAVAGKLLVGYLTILPIEPVRWDGRLYHRRWERLPGGRELGSIEVSRGWRGRRRGERLVLAAFADGAWDATIVISVELSWHWDYEELHLSKREYRALLQRLLARAGFRERKTDEPDVASDPANMLMVRIGPRAPEAERVRFESLLFTGERL
ncbi:MAG: hypothetical protein M3Q65_25800 [Chloroflexota bacterium]|nr:hypothetical protein [Chloroflexota bacterium]